MMIREMDISDYPQVFELWSNSEGMLLRDADSEENIKRYLKHNPNLSFVAIEDDKIVGAILAGSDGRSGFIQHLVVNVSYRGKGIGKALISKTIDSVTKLGMSQTHLFVGMNNVKAQAFYDALGWFPRDEARMYSFDTNKKQS